MKWLEDIDKKSRSMPFGELTVVITRHRQGTSKIEISKDSEIMPKSNEQAFLDLETLLNSLINAKMTGKVQFEIDFKTGTMSLITIKNKEVRTYD